MKRQPCSNTPARIGHPGGHRGCALGTRLTSCRLRPSPALRRRAEVIDRAHQIQAMRQRAGLPRQRSAPACQRGASRTKRHMEALDVSGVDPPMAVGAVPELLHPDRRPRHDAALDRHHSPRLVPLDDLCAEDGRAWHWKAPRGRSGAQRVGGTQAVGTQHDGVFEGTRLSRRRSRGRSRCSLPSPASHNRRLPSSANAIPTMPPCFLTRLSSACTCPRSRGCSTRCGGTACPWPPPRPSQPTRHRPFVKPKRHDDGWQWTAVGHERDHKRHSLGRGPQAVERRALRGGERLVTRRAQKPPVPTRQGCDCGAGLPVLWRDTPNAGRLRWWGP
jgi:hypothetical protein